MSLVLNIFIASITVIHSVIKGTAVLIIQEANNIADDSSGLGQLKLIVILLGIITVAAILGLIFAVISHRKLKNKYKIVESQHDEIAGKNAELAFQNESLEELNMEKNNMISVVAHDLKAPLGNIQGLVQLIKLEEKVLTKDQQKYLGMLKKVSSDAANMVDVMLSVNRIESELHLLTLHDYNIVEIISKVVRLHEPAARLKKTKIVFAPGMKDCTLSTDKQYFHQIISNILQNAVDIAPENTGVILRLVENENTISISITDFGVGISEPDQKRLFGGFTKLEGDKREGKHTGIGLTIVFRLVEKLKGKIRVESEVGAGSTFTVEFAK